MHKWFPFKLNRTIHVSTNVGSECNSIFFVRSRSEMLPCSAGPLIRLTLKLCRFYEISVFVLMWKVIKEQDRSYTSSTKPSALAPWSDEEAICLISSKLAVRISRFSCPPRTDDDHSSMLQLAKCHAALWGQALPLEPELGVDWWGLSMKLPLANVFAPSEHLCLKLFWG